MSRELLQQALDALEALQGGCTDSDDGTVEAITVWCPEVIDALREALAAPMPEPVIGTKTWFEDGKLISQNLTASDVYAAPPAAPAPVVPDGAVPAGSWEHLKLMMQHSAWEDTLQLCDALTNIDDFAKSAAPVVPLTDDMVEAEFVSRGDNEGQGLHPYWKDAFREGFKFARSQLSAAPVVREPLTGDQLWDLWRRRGESPQFIDFVPIVRDVERAHGIGGGGNG